MGITGKVHFFGAGWSPVFNVSGWRGVASGTGLDQHCLTDSVYALESESQQPQQAVFGMAGSVVGRDKANMINSLIAKPSDGSRVPKRPVDFDTPLEVLRRDELSEKEVIVISTKTDIYQFSIWQSNSDSSQLILENSTNNHIIKNNTEREKYDFATMPELIEVGKSYQFLGGDTSPVESIEVNGSYIKGFHEIEKELSRRRLSFWENIEEMAKERGVTIYYYHQPGKSGLYVRKKTERVSKQNSIEIEAGEELLEQLKKLCSQFKVVSNEQPKHELTYRETEGVNLYLQSLDLFVVLQFMKKAQADVFELKAIVFKSWNESKSKSTT